MGLRFGDQGVDIGITEDQMEKKMETELETVVIHYCVAYHAILSTNGMMVT